jgi:hypothetical protein
MAKPVKAIPDEYPGATPYLCVKGPRALATHKEDLTPEEIAARAAAAG